MHSLKKDIIIKLSMIPLLQGMEDNNIIVMTSAGTYRWKTADKISPSRKYGAVALTFLHKFLMYRSRMFGSVSLLLGSSKPEKLKKDFPL